MDTTYGKLSKYKVLIAEDEYLLQMALHKIISEQPDFEICFEAGNGKAAIDYLCCNKADIVITDIRMPVMDGLELITQIRDNGIRVKTIVVSGYNDFEYAKHMLNHGAFSYLLKPLVPEELIETLHAAAAAIREEERRLNILKSHKFNALQQKSYVHFTDEMPPALLNAHEVYACCVDFGCSPRKASVEAFQYDLESIFYPGCCFLLDSYLYLITNLDEPKRDRIEITTELQSYFSDIDIPVKIGIGLTVSSMMDIYQSMKQARRALRFYERLPYNEFVDYERISLLEDPTIPYPLTEEKSLLEAVRLHHPETVNMQIIEFQNHLAYQDKDVAYQMLTELTISCKRELALYQIARNRWTDILFQIEHRYPLDSILEHIRQLLLDAQQQLRESHMAGNRSAVVTACDYIERHLKEPITLEEVANECFLSKSHFCKIFKEETGKTFKAYLNEKRIECAKILLKNSSLKNYEVALEVGLEDASYFNELFKRMAGMTPAEFREN